MTTEILRLNEVAQKIGVQSSASVGLLSKAELRSRLGSETSSQELNKLHSAATRAYQDALIFEKKLLTRNSPLLPQAIRLGLKQPDVSLQDYEEWFGDRAGQYAAPGEVSSMFSSAKYLTELYREAKALYPATNPWHIDFRRPDLQNLVLSQNHLDKEVSALSLSNEILLEKVGAVIKQAQQKEPAGLTSSVAPDQSGMDAEDSSVVSDDVLKKLAEHVGSGGTPYHFHHNRLRQVRSLQDPDFSQLLAAPQVLKHLSGASLAGIYYDIPPALYDLLTDDITEENAEEKFTTYFPGLAPDMMLQPARLRGWFGLNDAELQAFLGSSDSEPEYIDDTLTLRLDDKILRLVMTRVSGTTRFNYFHVFPLGKKELEVRFKLNLQEYVHHLLAISDTESNARFETVTIDSKDSGDEILIPGKEYRGIIQLKDDFNTDDIDFKLYKYQSGGGGFTYYYNLKTQSLSPALYVLKLNKAIRLYKATGLSPRMLEDIVNSVNANQITNETLSLLFHTALLMKQYAISHDDALVMAAGQISLSAPRGEMSHFDRLFNTPPLVEGGFYLDNTSVYLNPDKASDHTSIKATLKRACQTDDNGLYMLGQIYAQNEGTNPFIRTDIKQVSQIYTLSLWARLHGLTPTGLFQIMSMLGLPDKLYNQPAAVWLGLFTRLQTTINWLNAHNWSVAELELMTRDVSTLPTGTEINNLLLSMKEVLLNEPDALQQPPQDTEAWARPLVPLTAAVFNLSGETSALSILIWADKSLGGNALRELWLSLQSDEQYSDAAIAFAYRLAQLALIVHATGITTDALRIFVDKPAALLPLAQDNATGTLALNIDTIKALTDFSNWLKMLPDPAGAGSALVGALDSGNGVTAELLAQATGLSLSTVRQAIKQANTKSDVADELKLISWQELSVVLQWLTLSDAFGVMPDNIGAMLSLDYVAGNDNPSDKAEIWARWRDVANAFEAGLSPAQIKAMNSATESPLSLALTGYLCSIENFSSPEALNQHLLLDSLNGPQVITSRIAEAIAALQLFIHRTLADPEDKNALIVTALDRQFFRDWTQWNSRFATWAAGQQLMYYPENFIDPTVRLGQTKAMDDMLQVLGQAQINGDTVGDAFQGYLSAFEEVANLKTISGYHDSINTNEGKTWFIGSTLTEPREYWWRSVDEGKRGPEGILPANAWTGWTNITVPAMPFNEMIRPVIYKGRLYLGWLEREERIISYSQENKAQYQYLWSLKIAWLRYDGTWSAPVSYSYSDDENKAIEDLLADSGGENISFYLSVWPSPQRIIAGVYKKSPESYQADFKGEISIYEDMSLGKKNVIEFNWRELVTQLDPKGVNRICLPFYEIPLAENRLTDPATIPTGFTKFDISNFYASVSDVDEKGEKYRLSVGYVLNIDTKRGEIPNKYIDDIVNHTAFTMLDSINTKQKVLVRGSHGAYLVVAETSSGYIILDREALPREWFSLKIRQVTNNNDGKWAIAFYDVVTNQFYVSVDITENKDDPLSHRFQAIITTNPEGATEPLSIANILQHPMHVDEITPALYYRPIRLVVPGGDVRRRILGGGIKSDNYWVYEGEFKLGDEAITLAASQSTFPILNNTYFTYSGTEVIHTLELMFGENYKRSWKFRVHKDYGDLSVDIIGTHVTNGETAQYLQHDNIRTRLNTLFARQLTERAALGIDTILSYDTQFLPEPDIGYPATAELVFEAYNPEIHEDGSYKVYYVGLNSNTSAGRTIQLAASGRMNKESSSAERVLIPLPDISHKGSNGEDQAEKNALFITVEFGDNSFDGSYYKMFNYEFNRENKTFQLDGSYKVPGTVSGNLVNTNSVMDFTGANALYFWELFYYTPMMVMQRFLQEERFDLAEQWLKYVFSPAGYRSTERGGAGRIWNVRPLEEDTSWNDEPLKSYDPDAVAQNDPMHYKMNAFMRLLDITLGRGDAAYRKLERDSLTEAKVWYQRAMRLLGDAPWTSPGTGWGDPALGEAASEDALNDRLTALEKMIQGASAVDIIRPQDAQQGLAVAGRTLFLPEVNRVMLGYWEALRIRLYNLRHNLTLDGQPLNLPLYAAPADAKALMAAAVAAEAGGESALPVIQEVPALRFIPLMEGARTMASQLMQFGSAMQNILERQDAEALAELLTTQGAELAASSVTVQKQMLQELAAERVTYEKSLEAATVRHDHYRKLYEQNVNARELQAMDLQTTSQTLAASAKGVLSAGAALGLAPNVFGLANGGMKYDGPLNAVGIGITIAADGLSIAGSRISQEEMYRRRREEWQIQYQSAEKEMAVVRAQLDALSVRETSVSMQIAHAELQSAQAQAQLALFQSKFTGKTFYSWLRARLATIFYTWYDLTASRCMMAQKALQWEKGDSATYLRTGTWSGAWAGLMSGEGLMLALGQMENAWVKWQKRELEVNRTVSLAALLNGKLTAEEKTLTLNEAINTLLSGKAVETDNTALPLSKLTLENGQLAVNFGLKELGLAAGFESSSSLRIRSVAVSLPTLLGPYQDIRARLRTDAQGLPAGCNECSISSGMQDKGLFMPDGGDSHPRWGSQWLPFEGLNIAKAGDTQDKTVMTLSFEEAADEQKSLLENLSDIILHVQFTAR